MNSIQIIGVGALNTDLIYKVERILEDGETAVDWAKSFPGGSSANTIYGLAKLGISTGFCGAVGDDQRFAGHEAAAAPPAQALEVEAKDARPGQEARPLGQDGLAAVHRAVQHDERRERGVGPARKIEARHGSGRSSSAKTGCIRGFQQSCACDDITVLN